MKSSLTVRLSFVLSGAVVLYALPALAEATEGAKPGLPQLDTSLFPEQLFWLAVTFTTLYLLMAFVALPRVQRTQDNRHAAISAEIEAAGSVEKRTKSMMAYYEKTLSEARTEAQVTVATITAQAAKESAEQQSMRQQELNKRLHDTELTIIAARDAAIRDINSTATEIGYSLFEKVAGIKVNGTSGGGRS